MKSITIMMPTIKACSVSDCGFNIKDECYAKAITIGNEQAPNCNTFFKSPDEDAHIKTVKQSAGVSACKLSNCQFNTDYACTADEVLISQRYQKANCATYLPR